MESLYKEDDFIRLDDATLAYYNILKKHNAFKHKNIYCVNCGEKGHVLRDCNGPITSFGIIAFKTVYSEEDEKYDKNNKIQKILKMGNVTQGKRVCYTHPHKEESCYPKIKFLMIQRKDTMGYTDFVRGKYDKDNVSNAGDIIKVCLNEMTKREKDNLVKKSFDQIWEDLWINHDSKCFKNEYEVAKHKFSRLNIKSLVDQSEFSFDFEEFGFPKGRRNMKENNIACAEREFYEETGYDNKSYEFIKNYPSIREEFIGTNGISYRHVYYLVKMKPDVSPPYVDVKNKIQTGEVQNIGWFTFDECISLLRPYDVAKKNMLENVYYNLLGMNNNFVCSNFYHNTRSPSMNTRVPFQSFYKMDRSKFFPSSI